MQEAFTSFWNLLTAGELNLQSPSTSYKLRLISEDYTFDPDNQLEDLQTISFANTTSLESYASAPGGFSFSFKRAIWAIPDGFSGVNAVVLTFVDDLGEETPLIYSSITPSVGTDSLQLDFTGFITLATCG